MVGLDTGRSRPLAAAVPACGFFGASGFAGSAGNRGGSTDLPLAWLEGSPSPDTVLPGLALLGVLSVPPLAVTDGVSARRWRAGPGPIAIAVAVPAWVAVQVRAAGWGKAPQWLYRLLGVAVPLAALHPSVRRFGRPREPVARIVGGR